LPVPGGDTLPRPGGDAGFRVPPTLLVALAFSPPVNPTGSAGFVALPCPPGPDGCNDNLLVDLRGAGLSDLDGLRSTGTGSSVRPIGVAGRPGNSRLLTPGSGDDGIRDNEGILGRGGAIPPPRVGFPWEAFRDCGLRIDIPNSDELALIPSPGVPLPDADPTPFVLDTTRLEPTVDAGVVRPEDGNSARDGDVTDTPRKADGGGSSFIDRRDRSLESDVRLDSVRSLVNVPRSTSGWRGRGDGDGKSSFMPLPDPSPTMTHPGLSAPPPGLLWLATSLAFSLLPPSTRVRSEAFRIRGKGTRLIFCSSVRTRARISPTICTAVPRFVVVLGPSPEVPFGTRGRGVIGGAPNAGEFRAVGNRVGTGDEKVGRVLLRRSESGMPLELCAIPVRERSADCPFGVRTTVGIAMPVPGRRVTDIVLVDGDTGIADLARGVTFALAGSGSGAGGAGFGTRSSSWRSDEVRDAAEGVGERESCDDIDLAELVAVEGADGNCGWLRANSTR